MDRLVAADGSAELCPTEPLYNGQRARECPHATRTFLAGVIWTVNWSGCGLLYDSFVSTNIDDLVVLTILFLATTRGGTLTVWKVIAGNCRLSRPIARTIAANGFAIADVDTMYLPKTPRFAGWNEWGSARPA